MDKNDQAIGYMPKLEAHQKGILHRAFSVFVLNSQGKLLLQKRAESKYHSPNLWANTCCSHPYIGESVTEAAHRRLDEEMGLSIKLKFLFSFIYKADVGGGLTENEFDHVFVGETDTPPIINPQEVAEWKWISLENLKDNIENFPHHYTIWLQIIFPRFYKHFTKS